MTAKQLTTSKYLPLPQRFDAMLRQGNSDSGIRHKEDIVHLAKSQYLELVNTYTMPANNQLLVFRKY